VRLDLDLDHRVVSVAGELLDVPDARRPAPSDEFAEPQLLEVGVSNADDCFPHRSARVLSDGQ
jgi:hypothetical protein